MKLAIISHTEHYKHANGIIVGWGSTVNEINHLAEDFEEIYHIAFLHPEAPPASSLPYTRANIHFIPLLPVGGPGIWNKLKIITSAPQILRTVSKILKKVDVFQFRAPTGIGVYVIPYLTLFSKKKGWFKYAGSWDQDGLPWAFALQRWMLKKQKRKVTINGQWPNQPKHCLTFENPCLTKEERVEGEKLISIKTYKAPFSFCFVGRLEDSKGVHRILNAFEGWEGVQNIDSLHLVGSGEKEAKYKKQVEERNLPVVFHGFLEREKVFDLYKKSHFIILPSDSEGFPKVIAEAMNYGCIPIVSNVSSVGQYVNSKNGFILDPCTSEELVNVLQRIVDIDDVSFKIRAKTGHKQVEDFTFEHYRKRLQSEIISAK